MWAHTHKQFETRENLTEKQKVTRVSGTKNLAFNLVILVRIPPNFLYKSRVLHLVCTPTGVYSGKGGPVVLTFCFSKLYSCRQLWMEMEIMLVFYSGIWFQKVIWVQHWDKDVKKSCWITGRFNLKIFDKKNFVCVPSYPEGGICGAFYSDEIHSYFPSIKFNTKCRTAHTVKQ